MKSTRRCGCAVIPLLGLLSNNDRGALTKNSHAEGDAGDDKDNKWSRFVGTVPVSA